jgi:6-pyruvoyltetrahydropterin/6-carboxytetrahydropterin synthase
MFEIDVEESFAAGHALRGYVGKCENLHGHNYRVRLTVAGDALDQIGLLCDFKDVKNLLNEVIARLDHQYLNDIEPFRELNPSAENLARYVFRETNSLVATTTQGRASVKRVKVWETDRNAVTYIE